MVSFLDAEPVPLMTGPRVLIVAHDGAAKVNSG